MAAKKNQMYDISGSEGNDAGALTPEQQTKLNQFKIDTRIDNEKYLRDHPEVGCLLTGFLGSILQDRPENVREFASRYFSDKSLPDRVTMQVNEMQQRLARATKQ